MSAEDKKFQILNFIKNNPKTNYREIKNKFKTHPERIFKKGLKQAFEEAKVSPPRNFDKKNREEKEKILFRFIKKNPLAGGQKIRKETKINFLTIFKDTKEMFEKAGIKYPREKLIKIKSKNKSRKKEEIINLVKKNPLITIQEIKNKTGLNVSKYFKNTKEVYKRAGLRYIPGHEKRLTKKRNEVISFIKKNNFATQREINKVCKTHVQEVFKSGIFGAYKKAGIKFPYQRIKIYGTSLKEIKKRAQNFEAKIAIKLSEYGTVNRLIKTKRGIADIIFERKNKKAIVEIKDYQNKEISISQIKQLNKYLEDTKCNLGFLICHKKPKKDRFLIGNSKIFILEESELTNIPKLLGL